MNDVIHFVDLGLSTKWANCNIGATKPEEYGDYFAWGETSSKNEYVEETYEFYDSNTHTYVNLGDNISGSKYDAAYKKWGKNWRMPTVEEMNELLEKCTVERASIRGVNGLKVIGPNGNCIFLPVAGCRHAKELNYRSLFGYYWTATSNRHEANTAHSIFCDCDDWYADTNYRYCGLSIRPVTNKGRDCK